MTRKRPYNVKNFPFPFGKKPMFRILGEAQATAILDAIFPNGDGGLRKSIQPLLDLVNTCHRLFWVRQSASKHEWKAQVRAAGGWWKDINETTLDELVMFLLYDYRTFCESAIKQAKVGVETGNEEAKKSWAETQHGLETLAVPLDKLSQEFRSLASLSGSDECDQQGLVFQARLSTSKEQISMKKDQRHQAREALKTTSGGRVTKGTGKKAVAKDQKRKMNALIDILDEIGV